MTVRPEPRRGLYEDPFWEWVNRHELRLQRCGECGRYRYPPGPACPHCLSATYAWQPLSGKGRLLSWAVFHRGYFETLPPPYIVASVETHEGPIMVGNLAESADVLSLHAPVEVYFESALNAEGREFTIPQWRLAG